MKTDRGLGRSGCLLLLALGLGAPAAGLWLWWLAFALSAWSALLAAGLTALSVGLAALLRHKRRARAALVAGACLIVGPWLWRAIFARGTDAVYMTKLPSLRSTRLMSTLYPEPDGSIAAAGLLTLTGGLNDEEGLAFPEILRQAYARTNPPSASLPTPAIATYLGLQSPLGFDTIVIEPPGVPEPSATLIFLHGFAGNFYVYCWEVAQAAKAAGLRTLCPSVDPNGAWWTPNGDRTLRSTLEYARTSGAKRIYLAGLSNGAAGASVLALEHEAELRGLILISGMRADRPPSLPVLMVQGKTDRMMPASYARAYAARGRVKYREIDGGHLILLSRHEQVRPLISEFLRALETGH